MPSAFITFEGPEGSGKSTQAGLLCERLREEGHKVKLTREPGGEKIGEEIRKILLDGADHSISDRAELLLYLAARAQHTERVIVPHLEEDFVVICARYIDSTVAYQGYGSGIDIDLINRMNDFATNGLVPNLTFLLDIDIELGLRRQEQWNRMERKAVDFHERVRRGFLELAGLYPNRIVVIDGSQDVETIQKMIMETIAERLALHQPIGRGGTR